MIEPDWKIQLETINDIDEGKVDEVKEAFDLYKRFFNPWNRRPISARILAMDPGPSITGMRFFNTFVTCLMYASQR